MKKNLVITLITVTLFGSLSLFSQPLSEGFETETAPPEGWIMRYANPNPPAGNLMTHHVGIFHQGERSFRFSSFSRGVPYDQYLITPRLETSQEDRTISFYYRKHQFGQEVFRVGWSTTGTDLEDFQWSDNINNATDEWQQFVKNDLPIGNSIYVCIHYFSDYEYYLYIDTVVGPEIYTPEEPPAPANIVSPANRATGVPIDTILRWEAGDAFTRAYDVYFGVELPDEPTSSNQRADTFNPGELDYDTRYLWQIVPLNEFGATEDPPVWSFTTVSQFDWSESFEGEEFPPEGWQQGPIIGDTQWRRASGGHNNNPAGAADGQFNALFYGDANRGHSGYLITPGYDASEVNIPMLRFSHAQAVWAGDQDTLRVYYSDTDDEGWELIEAFGNDIPQWTDREYYLPQDLETVYIRFEAITDYGWGIVIDNVRISPAPDNPSPSHLTVTNITETRADLGWRENGEATRWDIELGLAGFEPTEEPNIENTDQNPHRVTNLQPSTRYEFYVRANAGDGEYSNWTGPFGFQTSQIPATLPFAEGFEEDIHWQFVNDDQVNKWHVGTATAFAGNRSAYISNDNGENNTYTITTASVTHIYRDIEFPEDATSFFELSFQWKAMGESADWFNDYLQVHLIPTNQEPVAGELLTTGQLGGNLNWQEDWTEQDFLLPDSLYAGETMRLVFTWRNDNSVGTQPPAAIDNITIVQLPDNVPPRNLRTTEITHNSALLGWTEIGAAESWDIELGVEGFEPTGNPTQANVGDNPYRYENLDGLVTYHFYVRSVLEDDEFSDWAGPGTFTTSATPASLPFFENFEGDLQLVLANDDQTNKWYQGHEAAYAGNQGLYISDTDGRNHQYNITSTSIVHAYRDIEFPDIDLDFTLSYWWKGMGEGGFFDYDYMTVHLVDRDVQPVAGTRLLVGQIGENHLMQEEWTQENHELSAETYAGTVKKLVFTWINDSSVGTQPPAAIDNVLVTMDVIPGPEVSIRAEDGHIYLEWEDSGIAGSYRILASDNLSDNLDDWEEVAVVTRPRYSEPVGERTRRFYRVTIIVGDGDGRRESRGQRNQNDRR